MGSLRNTLALLEARLQTLIEGSAARLFASEDLQEELGARLTEALHAGVKQQPDGVMLAPNLFVVSVHPSQTELVEPDARLLDVLAQTVREAAEAGNLVLLSPPVMRVVTDLNVAPRQVQVKAQISIDNLAETSDMIVDAAPNAPTVPLNAFLIVDGMRIFQLDQPVVNIGRRPDNTLVIEDARVSRVHAQLRAIKSRYVIFDLDSMGGTFVNDQPVHQSLLYPGDVISLAGVPLVFGQDESRLGETQKLSFE
jgi:hypothetical protein